MGTCQSSPNEVVANPVIEDNFERNRKTSHKELKQGSPSRTFASNSSEADTSQGLDSIDHDKYRIQLYEAIYLKNWRKTTELINSTRFMQSADYIDRYERTCLHWACIKSAPLPITQNLIAAYADALLMQDHLGKTPLHLACEFGTDSSIYLLLGASSQATLLRDKVNGRTPLAECLLSHRPLSAIDNVLNSNPKSIIIPDNNANTPTVIFFNLYLGLFMSFTGKLKGTWQTCNDNVEDLIETAGLLLRAEIRQLDTSTHGSHPQDLLNENEGSDILLDSILSPTCPFAFVEFLLGAYPELADVRDRFGDLPIHVAASLTPNTSKTLSQMYKCNGCGEPQSDNTAHYHRRDPKVHVRQFLCHGCIEKSQICNYKRNSGGDKIELIIKSLLSINSEYAQKCNHEGLTPLNIGIKAGHNWDENSIEELMVGYSDNTTPSSCKVEIESNHKISMADGLETSVSIINMAEPEASEPATDNDSLQGSLSSIAHDDISITKDLLNANLTMNNADLTSYDYSQASLSSVAHDSKTMTETVETSVSIESVTLNAIKEIEEATDDSSKVSIEKTCQSACVQTEENKPTSTIPEDDTITNSSEENNVDTENPTPAGGLICSLRSHLTSTQAISSIFEVGIAVLA